MATKRTDDVDWRRRSSARITAYPWTEWLDGSAWTITRGEDFTVPVDSMRHMLYRAVVTYADYMRIRTQVDGDSITFQALPFDQR